MAKKVTGEDIFGGIFAGTEKYSQEEEQHSHNNNGLGVSCMMAREKLHEFKNHPFRVVEDEKMQELADSIRDYGILEPLLVRPDPAGGYEIISGHRRNYGAGLAGVEEVPVTITDMDDDMATIVMVDSNNKRELLFPSEKAKSYRMKIEAIKHQGKRTDLASEEKKVGQSADMIGSKSNESARTIQRYIRLTYLKKELLDYVDEGKLPMTAGYVMSFLGEEGQEFLLHNYNKNQKFPTPVQLRLLINYQEAGKLTEETVEEVLSNGKSVKKPNTSKSSIMLQEKSIKKYFPDNSSNEYMEQIILELLEKWAEENFMNS